MVRSVLFFTCVLIFVACSPAGNPTDSQAGIPTEVGLLVITPSPVASTPQPSIIDPTETATSTRVAAYTPLPTATYCPKPDPIQADKLYEVRWGGRDHPRDTVPGSVIANDPDSAWNSSGCYFDMNIPKPTPGPTETPTSTETPVVVKPTAKPSDTPRLPTSTPELLPSATPVPDLRSGYVPAGDGSDPNKKVALFTGLGSFQFLTRIQQAALLVNYNPNYKGARTNASLLKQGFLTFLAPGGSTVDHLITGQTACIEVPNENAYYGKSGWIRRALSWCVGQVFAISDFSTTPPSVVEEISSQ